MLSKPGQVVNTTELLPRSSSVGPPLVRQTPEHFVALLRWVVAGNASLIFFEILDKSPVKWVADLCSLEYSQDLPPTNDFGPTCPSYRRRHTIDIFTT